MVRPGLSEAFKGAVSAAGGLLPARGGPSWDLQIGSSYS